MTSLFRSASIALYGILSSPIVALAEDPQTVIDSVGSTLGTGTGEEAGEIAINVATLFVPTISFIAMVVVVISGITLTFSQSEEQVAVARRTLIAAVAGIMLVFSAGALRDAVSDSGGGGFGEGSAVAIGLLIRGVSDWVQVPLASLAVMMIIISGIRTVISWGSDDGLQQLRRTVVSVIFGFTLVAMKFLISDSIVGSGTPDPILFAVATMVNTILGLVSLLAVIVIVIAGIMMIVNLGNDDQYSRAKNLIVRVAIGLLVILSSWAIANIFFISAS